MTQTDVPIHDVYAVGNAIVDVISQVDDEFLASHGLSKGAMTLIDAERSNALRTAGADSAATPGGSAANTASGIVSLGGSAMLVAAIGDDGLGAIFSESMDQAGVRCRLSVHAGRSTSNSVIHVTPCGQRTMSTHLDAAHSIPIQAIDPSDIRASQCVLLEGYLWSQQESRAAALRTIEIARAEGVPVVFGASSVSCIRQNSDAFSDLLRSGSIDMLFANEEEAAALAHTGEDSAKACEILAGQVDTLVVTKGPDGAAAYSSSGRVHVPSEPVAQVVDTTGAGDAFCAGYIHGWLSGLSKEGALRIGAICAAEAISHVGARAVEDLRTLVARNLD